ncbi:LOW QUALITY PROTEIN: MFS drug transporter [Geosmithia morbida]|uniref:MFS drug transporter n=1 Tax=Geosmithia morbida TaxID=1094350 RepID=A0A9P4YU94_9HYPO|nr:LOW QUALITY PROTEIN: MFS drug transporter [Geosmithia morbida]KAF4121927.1 LOW QUALITY PROTEIN: MFS drug transporter [Geosmithia morbida]
MTAMEAGDGVSGYAESLIISYGNVRLTTKFSQIREQASSLALLLLIGHEIFSSSVASSPCLQFFTSTESMKREARPLSWRCPLYLNELKLARHPVVPMHRFKTPPSAAAYSACFLNAFSLMGVTYYLPLYPQAVLLAVLLATPVMRIHAPLCRIIVSVCNYDGHSHPVVEEVASSQYCGLRVITLGIGPHIDIGLDVHWAKLAVFGGARSSMKSEPPLLDIQTAAPVRDAFTATAATGFV